jgi:hypothetical protein
MESINIILCLMILGQLFIKNYIYKAFTILISVILLKPNIFNLFFLIIGFLLAPFLINFFINLIYGKKQIINYGFSIKSNILIDAIMEELLWREMLFQYILPNTTLKSALPFIAIIILLFLGLHNIKTFKNFFEMLQFTLLLYISGYLLPGLNYGLHCGRNSYIENLELCMGGIYESSYSSERDK